MARKDYKVDEQIRVMYRAIDGSTSVNMDVFDETDTLDSGQSGTMVQLGTSNRWVKSFTPDANGNWSVVCSDDKGGNVPRDYSVGDYNIQSIGAGVASVDAKVDASEASIRGADDDTLKTISDQIDVLPQVNPPMIG